MKHSPAIKEKAIDLYKQGCFMKDISKELGISYGSVQKWVSEEGLSKHRGPKSKIGREDFFDEIDSEEKAYYLGWLMADGNVSIYNGQYSIKAHIGINDKEIIDGFLCSIQSTNKTKDKGASYYVSITSRHMVESLMKLGVMPSKTGSEILPDMPAQWVPHFIRGFFDGDGITDVSQRRTGFTSNHEMLKQILSAINEERTIHDSRNVSYFLGGKKFSQRLYNYLYADATIFLKRKKDRVASICGHTEVTVK